MRRKKSFSRQQQDDNYFLQSLDRPRTYTPGTQPGRGAGSGQWDGIEPIDQSKAKAAGKNTS